MENSVGARQELPPARDLALRYAEGSAPDSVGSTAKQGKSNGKGQLRIG
jgi:putative transposase